MNQREVDIFFWDAVSDSWAELAAKPIIMDGQACHHPKVSALADRMLKRGFVSEQVLDFVQQEFADPWGLSTADLGVLIGREALYLETLRAVSTDTPNYG